MIKRQSTPTHPNHRTKMTPKLADAIVRLRAAHGMSQTDLARHLVVTHATVWRWETAKRMPWLSHLREFIKMAPEKLRPVFEEAAKMTIEQVAMESSSDTAAVLSDKLATIEEMAVIVRERSRKLYLTARAGDKQSKVRLQKLAALLLRWAPSN